MAYRIGRSLAALLAAYLLAGFAAAVIQESGHSGRPLVERLITDAWREIQCYFSSRRTCCGWGYSYSCPLTKTFIVACFAFAFSIVPVGIMMYVVRRFNWRRPLSEILIGGGLGALAAVLAAQIPNSDNTYPSLDLFAYALPGMIGGVSYWLIAGRPKPPSS